MEGSIVKSIVKYVVSVLCGVYVIKWVPGEGSFVWQHGGAST